jgi:nucleotide-binding universal stress UspA family protein
MPSIAAGPLPTQARPHGHAGDAPARPVVAVCDGSRTCLNAAVRGALVARDMRVKMQLLYPEQEGAHDRRPSTMLASFLERVLHLHPLVGGRPVRAEALDAAVALTRDAVLVLPSRSGNTLRERIMGIPTERLIRLSRAPVLVVKQAAAHPYRRVLVAADLPDDRDRLLAMGASLAQASALTPFHALPAANGRASSPPDAARAIRAAEEARSADLIVIGKRRRGLWADYLLGSVTQRVLSQCRADVLVVPLPPL